MFKLGAELVGAGCMIVAMASTPWRMETLLVLVLSCASLAAARESHLTTKGKKRQISFTIGFKIENGFTFLPRTMSNME